MQCYKDEPNDNLANCESFKSKVKVTVKTSADSNTKYETGININQKC